MLSHLLIAVALVGQAGPAAPAPSSETLSQAYFLFLQARELEDQNDIDGAIAAYRRAAELYPQAAEIHAELALTFGRRGSADEALKEADTAIAIDAENRTARRVRGLVKADLSESTQDRARVSELVTGAIQDLEIVVADRVVDPTVDLTLGRLYVQAGQFDKGIERLRLFLLDRPEDPQALLLLADAYEGKHQPAAAVEALEGAAAQMPDQPRLWTRLAGLQERAGRWSEAATAWGKLADDNPRNQLYRTRQATALVNAGNLAAGRDILVKVAEQAPRDINVWYLLSQVDRRQGNATRAEEDARKIIAIDPADPRGPLALADARAARGDYRGVVQLLEPFVRAPRAEDVASGSFARTAGELASALGQTGDHKRAVSMLEEARKRDSDNVELAFSLGAAYDRAKRFELAERTLRQVIDRVPEHADALNYLGYMLAERGTKLDEAVVFIAKALAVEPDNPSYLDSLGWAYVKQARLDEARQPLEKAAAALPKTSVIQDHLAELYFRLELYGQAADAWDQALSGDRSGVDAGAIAKKRDKAKAMVGKR